MEASRSVRPAMKAWIVAAVLFLLGPVTVTSVSAAEPILPPAFAGWTISGPVTQLAPSNLERIASTRAPVFREYGIIGAERAAYSQGAQQARITLYRMIDPSAAFGAFTYLRDPKMTSVAGGIWTAYAAAAEDRALLVIGNLLLDISSSPARPQDEDLKGLADGLGPQADRTPYPIIAGYLPSPGLVANTEHYVLGSQAFVQAFPVGAARQRDWIGFDKSAEAIIARYRLDGQSSDKEVLLLIALYPTQQIAAERYDNLDKWIALNPDEDPGDGRPTVFGKRSGAMIAMLAGADSREIARVLLDQIQYGSQVTWNEPTHRLTDPSIGTIVVGAFMGTGAIMLFAVAGGLGFGGIRLFVKYLLPGKVFDRNDQVEILQLGLTAKPIDAKDFYRIDPFKKT